LVVVIKNLISVRALTRDNYASVTFGPFGFSIKDFRTGTILLRCDSTCELYPLRSSSNKAFASSQSFLASHSIELWHARLSHPGQPPQPTSLPFEALHVSSSVTRSKPKGTGAITPAHVKYSPFGTFTSMNACFLSGPHLQLPRLLRFSTQCRHPIWWSYRLRLPVAVASTTKCLWRVPHHHHTLPALILLLPQLLCPRPLPLPHLLMTPHHQFLHLQANLLHHPLSRRPVALNLPQPPCATI
jgi:hypothetical protein